MGGNVDNFDEVFFSELRLCPGSSYHYCMVIPMQSYFYKCCIYTHRQSELCVNIHINFDKCTFIWSQNWERWVTVHCLYTRCNLHHVAQQICAFFANVF